MMVGPMFDDVTRDGSDNNVEVSQHHHILAPRSYIYTTSIARYFAYPLAVSHLEVKLSSFTSEILPKMPATTLKLNNGQQIPALGLGCWMSKPVEGDNPETYEMVVQALKVGTSSLCL